MRSVKLNSATQFVPKYKEEELKMGDKKAYWERPDRYLQKDTCYKKSPDHYAYITVRDGRFINPDKTWECMPVAYISETGMIKYLNEDVQTIKKLVINYGWGEPEKVPEARDIINEWAVERYQEWWEVRNRHSIEDQLWNITEVGGYVRPICWNRSEGIDVALAARHALNEGVDPAKVAHDYAIVMWCSNYVEKEGYEYPDCADIDVSYITKLVQDAFNKGWYANKNEGRTSYTSRFAPKDENEENEENAVNSSRRSLKTQRAIRHCINSARRRAALQANRRLNCGYYYDGEDYSEMGYDKEQDAYYDLPDEMWIYRLNLGQLADLARDGVVSKHEIHEWIDELSEDWGGMPAWSPAKLIDRFEIQDLTKEQYDTWKANFAVESVRFRDELERRY